MPADELARLQGELAELKAKSAELADQFLRAKAEAENARRRAEEEVAKARKFGIESFAESLLPVATAWMQPWPSRKATPSNLRRSRRDPAPAHLSSGTQQGGGHQSRGGLQVRPTPASGDQRGALEQEPNTIVTVLQKAM